MSIRMRVRIRSESAFFMRTKVNIIGMAGDIDLCVMATAWQIAKVKAPRKTGLSGAYPNRRNLK